MRPPPRLRLLLLLLLLLRLPPHARAASDEARRIETTFTLLVPPAPAASQSANATDDAPGPGPPPLLASPSPSVSPAALAACPRTLALTKIRTYRGIRESTPDVALDGILWEHVEVSGTACDSSPSARTTTYFLPPSEPVCFSAGMRVVVHDPGCLDPSSSSSGLRRVSMSAHRIGAELADGLGPVVSFSHAAASANARLLRLHVRFSRDNGTAALELSAGHLVMTAAGAVMTARSVRAGDVLGARRARGVAHVTRVEHGVRVRGLYAPVTTSGRLLVNDVICSCYTDAFAEREAHALLAPVRAAARFVAWDWCPVVDALRAQLWPA